MTNSICTNCFQQKPRETSIHTTHPSSKLVIMDPRIAWVEPQLSLEEFKHEVAMPINEGVYDKHVSLEDWRPHEVEYGHAYVFLLHVEKGHPVYPEGMHISYLVSIPDEIIKSAEKSG